MAGAPQWRGRRDACSPDRGHWHDGERRRDAVRESSAYTPAAASAAGRPTSRFPTRKVSATPAVVRTACQTRSQSTESGAGNPSRASSTRYPVPPRRRGRTPAIQDLSRRVHVLRLVREVEAAAQRHRDRQADEETEEGDARESFGVCAKGELMPGPPG
jgi:hypothetical protein